MNKLEILENKLYISLYGIPKKGNFEEVWNEIKSDKEVLRSAVEIVKDKFGQKDIVRALTISETILIDYETVDEVAYNYLIKSIFSSTDIARIVLDGASNGGYSFLLMSLWNPNLILTEEEKFFAVREAMNKIGTTYYSKKQDEFSQQLDEMGISDDNVTVLNIDGCLNPVGQKTGSQYMNYMFASLSDEQAHGSGEFDIRYYILKNHNWSLEEKQKLVMDFWSSDSTYDEYLELWEWAIINDKENYKGESLPLLDKEFLYDYTYEWLLEFYGNKKTTDRIWQDIQFCKLMHELRPQQWEVEYEKRKALV